MDSKEALEVIQNIFESIKHIDEQGNEFWYAKELMPCLDYKQWRRFNDVIEKAKIACKNSGFNESEQFLPISAKTSKQGGRPSIDYKLTRIFNLGKRTVNTP